MGIRVENLHKSFGDNEVLKGINFVFEAGKVNMIIGASGSGKSVFLRCIVGLLQPDEGEVIYDGNYLKVLNNRELRNLRKNIGMLFQGAALFDSMTVLENVAFPLQMSSNLKGAEIKERAQHYLKRVNLENVDDLFPAEISGGMKKRVGIARALVLEPKYLFCDEPNSGLDPQTGEAIDQLLRGLTEELGTTTVIISHDIKSVMSIGDKIMFLYKGHKEWEGTPAEIQTVDNKPLNQFIEISGVVAAFQHKAST